MSSDTEDETGPDEVAELAAFDAAKYERLELIRRARTLIRFVPRVVCSTL